MANSSEHIRADSNIPMSLSGSCDCGAVTYTMKVCSLQVYACHCLNCQTRSGCTFAEHAMVHASAFVCEGEVEAYCREANDIHFEEVVCRNCYTRLFNRNILNNAYFCGLSMGLRAGDKLCVPVPLYHCFGMVMSNLNCMVHGATIVYPSAGFDPLAVLETVEEEHCTALHGVPTMFIAELEHPEFSRFDLSSLRTGLMAGAPCPIEIMNKVMNLMHMSDVGVAYGMTETSPVSFQTAVSDPVERRVSTIGRVQPHLEVRIVDPATGETVQRGVPGELCTRGYSVMLGYGNDQDQTAEVVRDGWMYTGDLAVIDDEGYGRVVGRAKDMIIRGGENIYPREIEEFLFRHDSIEDVQVIGVPDDRFGEEVCACVRVRAGKNISESDVIAFCRGQIAQYKVPRYIRFMGEFPMTVTGKVQKNVLRDIIAAQLSEER